MQEHSDRRSAARLPMGEPTNVNDVVERNIRALLLRRRADEAQKALDERIADAVTRFTGSMRFVYIHLILFGGWIAINLGWIPFLEPSSEALRGTPRHSEEPLPAPPSVYSRADERAA